MIEEKLVVWGWTSSGRETVSKLPKSQQKWQGSGGFNLRLLSLSTQLCNQEGVQWLINRMHLICKPPNCKILTGDLWLALLLAVWFPAKPTYVDILLGVNALLSRLIPWNLVALVQISTDTLRRCHGPLGVIRGVNTATPPSLSYALDWYKSTLSRTLRSVCCFHSG